MTTKTATQASTFTEARGPDILLEVVAHMAPSPLVESRSSEEVHSDA